MIKYYFPWIDNNITFKRLTVDIKNNPQTTFVIFCPEEVEIYQPWFKAKKKIDKLLKEYNCNIEYWLLGLDEKDFCEGLDNIKQVRWPLFLALYTKAHVKITQHIDTIDKLFVCLNHRAHTDRAWFIDQLSKLNLLEKGYVSWHDKDREEFKFKYFNGKKLILDIDKFQDGSTFPNQYYKGLFNIICESNVNYLDLSEKTFGAILNKKPFLIHGAQNIHKKLQELGFEIFDEYFDYAFDKFSNYKKRSILMTEQLLLYKDADYNAMYKKMLPKLECNYNHLHKLIMNKNNIPKKFKYCYENHYNNYFDRQEYKLAYSIVKGKQ